MLLKLKILKRSHFQSLEDILSIVTVLKGLLNAFIKSKDEHTEC